LSKRWVDPLFTAILAIILSVGIWLYASSQVIRDEALSDIPLEIRAPKTISARTTATSLRQIKVRGTRSALDDLHQRSVVAVLPITKHSLKNIGRGREITFDVSSEWFNLPEGVQLLESDPPDVAVRVFPFITRKLKVQQPKALDIPRGYVVERMNITPPEVAVTGPSDIFDKYKLREIPTSPIELNFRRESLATHVRLDRQVEDVVLSAPETVIVEVIIRRVAASRVFEDVPVHILCVADPAAMVPVKLIPARLAKLRMEGPKEALEAITESDLRLFVEIDDTVLSELARGNKRKVEVKCHWPRLSGVRPALDGEFVTVDRKADMPASRPAEGR